MKKKWINEETRGDIRFILNYWTDSKHLSDESLNKIFEMLQKLEPPLDPLPSLPEVEVAFSLYMDEKEKNPEGAVDLFIESLRASLDPLTMSEADRLQALRGGELDRIQAILRAPEFIEDEKRLSESLARDGNGPESDEIRAFREKMRQDWDVQGFYQLKEINGECHIDIDPRPAFGMVSEQEWARVVQLVSEACGGSLSGEIPFWRTIEKTVYAMVQVDLSRSDEVIDEYFRRVRREWRDCTHIPDPHSGQRNKRGEYDKDMWEIHDRAQKGEKITDIARGKSKEDCPKGKRPGNYDMIRDTCQKATQVFQAVRNAMFQRRGRLK